MGTFQDMGIALALGYLLGSIPFGLFFAFISGAGDVRKIGSGNIGATNVLRTGRKWAAAATLLCDGAKGAVAVLLARHLLPQGAEIIAAAGAVLGHIFPVWLRFKGGKGVATFLGISLGLYWIAGLAVVATWLLMALGFRISSLSALIAVALAPFFFWLTGYGAYTPVIALLSLLVIVMHHANIRRLLSGTEPRIGSKGRGEG
jgi:glycerol-3-phosphate acyltransferase PlsY